MSYWKATRDIWLTCLIMFGIPAVCWLVFHG
jgi:hypothetical protein